MTRPTAPPRPAGPFAVLTLTELEPRDVPTFAGNQVFPLDNPWNEDISGAPVAADSAAIIGRIVNRHGTAPGLHPDFGNPVTDGALYGIPVNVVDASTPKVPVLIAPDGWADESDQVPVPIPANAVIEGDDATGPSDPSDPSVRGDSHLLVYDKTDNVLYELGSAARPDEASYPYGGSKPLGVWGAYQVSYWNLNTDYFRTIGFTSADAAGLPIMPGLVRPDEALPPSAGGQDVINHAIRMTVQQTRDAFVYPASHEASDLSDADLPRMGERFRLKASFVIPSTWSPEVRAVAQAMKTYGLIVADNGSDMFFQGVPSDQWNMDAMLQIGQIKATDFDVVDLTPVVTGLGVNAGPTGGGESVTLYGHNFSGAAGQLHVYFGSTPASSVTILSDSVAVAVAPAHAAGAVHVQVQSGGVQTDSDGQPVFFGNGTSVPTAADLFTFGGVSSGPVPQALPPSPLGVAREFAAGPGTGTKGTVGLYTAGGTARLRVNPFPGFAGGLRTAAADFTGDGITDVAVGTGPGAVDEVKVYDGATGRLILDTRPFGGSTSGVFLTSGDVTGDRVADLVITADKGGPAVVKVLRGGDFHTVASFAGLAGAPNFKGGLRAGVGDINGDGYADIAVTPGVNGGPVVSTWDGAAVASGAPRHLAADFFALSPKLRNGAYLAVGDVTGDGKADLIFGAGPGGGPVVRVIDGAGVLAAGGNNARVVATFFAGNVRNRGGVRVVAKDLDGDGHADLITGAGDRSGSLVNAYLGVNLALGLAPAAMAFNAFPGTTGGVYVG